MTSYEFSCPAGTRYDQALSMCNHQDLVPCPPSTTPMDSSTTPLPSTTTMSSQSQTVSTKPIDNETPLPTTIAAGTSDKPQTKPPRFEDRPPPSNPDTSGDKPSSSEESHDRPPLGTPGTSGDRPTQPGTGLGGERPPTDKPENPIIVKPGTSEDRPTNLESEVNIPDDAGPVFPPSNVTDASSQPDKPLYSVSPTSIYPCKEPGYYEEVTSCKQFYVCREVGPGILSADRIFKCPDRYLFDTKTHLCQREHKVTCQAKPSLFYTILNYLVVQLEEDQLDEFFKQSLTLPDLRGRTGISQQISNNEHRAGPELPLLYSLYRYPYVIVYQ